MTDSPEFANNSETVPESELDVEGWSGPDIEEAYRKALQAMEDIPWDAETTVPDGNEPVTAPSPLADPVLHDHLEEGQSAPEVAPAAINEAPSATGEQTPANAAIGQDA